MIPVTKPFLPPAEEYEAYLKGIWKRNWLTNMVPLMKPARDGIERFS